jgi:hypothetical protein
LPSRACLRRRVRTWLVGCGIAWAAASAARAASKHLVGNDPEGVRACADAPVGSPVTLNAKRLAAAAAGRLRLRQVTPDPEGRRKVMAQFEPGDGGQATGRLWWMMPPGRSGSRKFALVQRAAAAGAAMRAAPDRVTGRWTIAEAGRPVLSDVYQTNEPGDILAQVHPDNRKYARARSDYLHPVYGPDGEELTRDWSVDHPPACLPGGAGAPPDSSPRRAGLKEATAGPEGVGGSRRSSLRGVEVGLPFPPGRVTRRSVEKGAHLENRLAGRMC